MVNAINLCKEKEADLQDKLMSLTLYSVSSVELEIEIWSSGTVSISDLHCEMRKIRVIIEGR
jgi:hypothetical protein